jgi:hypothetical protein
MLQALKASRSKYNANEDLLFLLCNTQPKNGEIDCFVVKSTFHYSKSGLHWACIRPNRACIHPRQGLHTGPTGARLGPIRAQLGPNWDRLCINCQRWGV